MNPTVDSITQPNDIWLLGNHRLMCADSTDVNQVAQLMVGASADLAFLDPPYNVNYRSRGLGELRWQDHISAESFATFLQKSFLVCHAFMKHQSSLYVCHAASFQRECQTALESAGFNIRNQIIWAKNHFVLSWGRYKFQHEVIFYCHKKKQRDKWYGDNKQTTLWLYPKPVANRLHPTMKPIALIEKALRNSTQRDDIVLDLFAGSGSTLIACEQQQRLAYLMEIAPHYCDVIITRWQHHTGQSAYLQSTGMSFHALQAQRKLTPTTSHPFFPKNILKRLI